ncbi:8909_t:CDS:1 [Paraglomus occultum]|uniref:8909_t:CDS:1 n=1 Tax=Paraglomus occultum TaxID=144539 RepID=A0A9N9GAP5_9GLOM|nr:8909_t:CDS:1 [Paraglomus occultum]
MRVHYSYATVYRAQSSRISSSIFATKILKQKRMSYIKANTITSSATVSSSAETSKSTKHASNLLVYKNILDRQSRHSQKDNSTDKDTRSSDSIKQPELALLLSWRKIFNKRPIYTKRKQNEPLEQENMTNSSIMEGALKVLMGVLFKLIKHPHGTNRKNETMQATVDDTESLSMNQYMSPDYLELASKTLHSDSALTSVGEPSLRVFTIPFGYLDASLFSEYEDFDDEDFIIETSFPLDNSYKFISSEEDDEDFFSHLTDDSLLGSDIHKTVSDRRHITNELENEDSSQHRLDDGMQKLKSFGEVDSYKLTDSGIQHVKSESISPKSCKKKTKKQAGGHETSTAATTELKSFRSRTRGGGLQEDSIRRRAKRKRNSKTDNFVHL